MRVLFLHDHFPGQFGHLARRLAADPANRVVFLTREGREGALPGVVKRTYHPTRGAHPTTHHYIQSLERAVLTGQAVLRACLALRRQGFVPDVIYFHSGWGVALYIKEIFPEAKTLGYFEWYYRPYGSDADYLEPEAVSLDEACRIRTLNGPILLDLAQCDAGVCPTLFQRDQFPVPLRDKLTVLHDGIDTDFFTPDPQGAGGLPDLTGGADAEIVTYATRGLEPYRGFPQFMRAVARLQRERSRLQVVVVGSDTVAYSRRLPGGQSYRERMLAELPELDHTRLHFLGTLDRLRYRQVLRAATVHVYLTVPFVLSWSLLEAMATGCLIVGSDTAPVREVIAHGRNGLLADMRDPAALADTIGLALDHRQALQPLRTAARATIVEQYALARLMPRQIALLEALAAAGERCVGFDLINCQFPGDFPSKASGETRQ